MSMLNVKDSLMDHTPCPRMVFLGGSSVAYSVDCAMIRDSLHVSAINCGLSAGLGMKYILDEALPHLRKGDVVVVSCEYANLYKIMYGSPIGIAPAMFVSRFKNLYMLNAQQMLYCFAGVPTAIRMNMKSDMQDYDAHSFNEYGDVVQRMQAPPTRTKETIQGTLNEEYCQCFLERIRRMEEKGCRVLLSPPVVCKQSYQPEVAHEVAQWLSDSGYPYIVSPDRHCMPDRFGLDTDHHLTEEGSRVFTAQLINELKAAGCK